MPRIITQHIDFPGALITPSLYKALYQQSIEYPEAFWGAQARQYLQWDRPWDKVLSGDFAHNDVRWFSGGRLNVCVNCVDRHLPERADQTAIIWEGDEPNDSKSITYRELYEAVCRLANGLKAIGVQKGDRVGIYMPMIPEAAIAMLACARLGAVHSVVFAGFAPESLKSRIQDAQCKVIITADGNRRAGNTLPLKTNVDEIIDECPSVEKVVVVRYTGESIPMQKRDVWYHDLVANASDHCPPEMMEAADPLFILYTSGSTGKPKGILHGQAGYLLFVTMTFRLLFNYQSGERYWCTADVGWVTGHSYLVYGPLSNGATTLLFGGVPTYPTSGRFWDIVDKYRVNIFYSSPTALRALMRKGDELVKRSSRKSLRLLATVGEPINPDVWLWFYEVVGEGRCPIIDTWWQTETGGMMIAPFPGATPLKPGSATTPFFGVQLDIRDNEGAPVEGEGTGNLVITHPWPGQFQTIYGDPERYQTAYFSQFPGLYCAGDAAYRDKDGDYWMMGRTDDVINVSGHRLDTAEIESALVAHPKVSEAAVVGFPHEIKGQGIFVFVTVKDGVIPDSALQKELIDWVRKKISPIATPDRIQWADDLPKTRSGKIMRRLLRKIVNNDTTDLGDISTLSNPETVTIIMDAFSQLTDKK